VQKKIIIALLALVCIAALYAYTWPLSDGLLRFSFGANRNASFLRGVEFNVDDTVVQATSDGELLFAVDASALPHGFPVPGSSMVAIAHAQDIMSVYTGMEKATLSTYLLVVREGDILGRLAKNVKANDTEFMFYTYDISSRRFIHPFSIMPIVADTVSPAAKSLILKSGDREVPADQAKNIKQGSWEFLLDTEDSLKNGAKGIPFSVILSFDGAEQTRYGFDSVRAERGIPLYLSGSGKPGEEIIMIDGRLRLGTFNLAKGKIVVSLVVSDFAGNRREYSWPVTVQ